MERKGKEKHRVNRDGRDKYREGDNVMERYKDEIGRVIKIERQRERYKGRQRWSDDNIQIKVENEIWKN